MPPPNYEDWKDEYDDLFEDRPEHAEAVAAAPEQIAEHEGFISTDWSKLKSATNGDLADEEWMGGPTPTASRPLPQRSDWQRLGLYVLAISVILALGVAMVVLFWPTATPPG